MYLLTNSVAAMSFSVQHELEFRPKLLQQYRSRMDVAQPGSRYGSFSNPSVATVMYLARQAWPGGGRRPNVRLVAALGKLQFMCILTGCDPCQAC